MVKKTIERIVKKRLKWHKAEVAVLWLLIAIVAILIPAGIGVYFCVDHLAITQYVFAIPAGNLIVSQVKMVCYFARVLGFVFSVGGVVSTFLHKIRYLSFPKDSLVC